MVIICDKKYTNDEKYQSFFDAFSFPLSDFQKYAIESIVEGHHVLVTAHTGSGKTLPAEFAIEHFVNMGKKVIYTSPIKALSNQKYYEFTQKYPHISFGLITGDIKINPTADVLIMTAEILMNYLFTNKDDAPDLSKTQVAFNIDIQHELACVVMDEIHYINDAERGAVWEKTILMLPEHIQMVMLSATIDSPEKFAKWCEKPNSNKQVYLCNTNKRVVPLTHYGFLTTTEMIFKKIKDKAIQQTIKDATNCIVKLQDEHGKFQTDTYIKMMNMKKLFEHNDVMIKRNHVLNQLCYFMKEHDMLPAIVFVFSRKNVELFAKEVTANLLEDDSKIPYIVKRECDQIIRKLPNYSEYLNLPEYHQLVSLLEKGIGIHHSGMIPVLREIVELMISKKYIKVLFATESFAVGLSCPIRTAVFSSLTKFDGTNERFLLPHEYTQSAGRAGRRGIDTIGYVVHCNNLFDLPSEYQYKTILGGKPQVLETKFTISVPFVLNLMKTCSNKMEIVNFIEKSMLKNVWLDEKLHALSSELIDIQQKYDSFQKRLEFLQTPLDICEEYNALNIQLPILVNKKRKEAEKRLAKIKDEYLKIKDSALIVAEKNAILMQKNNLIKNIDYLNNYISNSVDNTCCFLHENQFIEINDQNIELKRKGELANCIAEINSVVFVEYLYKTDFMQNMTTKQIVGFLICFTDVKVSQEMMVSVPTTKDAVIQENIRAFQKVVEHYEELEDNYYIKLCSNSRNDLEIRFDMIDAIMIWCDCSSEVECKLFIQTELNSKSVSIGDFTKAVLKISTICKELVSLCETYEKLELLQKLSYIDGMILKYITTAQSLYL